MINQQIFEINTILHTYVCINLRIWIYESKILKFDFLKWYILKIEWGWYVFPTFLHFPTPRAITSDENIKDDDAGHLLLRNLLLVYWYSSEVRRKIDMNVVKPATVKPLTDRQQLTHLHWPKLNEMFYCKSNDLNLDYVNNAHITVAC